MFSVLMVVQVIAAITTIVLVLFQQGKGADMGSAFGSGSAGSLFGASGAANFLSRTTKWTAVLFFASTAGLAYVSHHEAKHTSKEGGVMQNYSPQSSPSSVIPQLPGATPSSVPEQAAVPHPAAPSTPSSIPQAIPSTPSGPSQAQPPSSSGATQPVPAVPSSAHPSAVVSPTSTHSAPPAQPNASEASTLRKPSGQ